MKESALWKKLNLLAKKNKWHLTRIESNTGVRGIPDVYCMVEGHSFWLELKSKLGKNCGLSNYQINWHLKHIRSGGKVFILVASTLQRGFEILKIHDPMTKTLPDSKSLLDSETLPDSRSLPYSKSLPDIHISQISNNINLEKLILSIL